MKKTDHRVIMRRRILLQNDAFIIFDYANSLWRCAFYRKRYKSETGFEPGVELWASLARAGMVPLVPRTNYCRFTATAPRLSVAIGDALLAGERGQDKTDVLQYIEGTEWGTEALAL